LLWLEGARGLPRDARGAQPMRLSFHRLSLRAAHTATTNGSSDAAKAQRSDNGPPLTTVLPNDMLNRILLAVDTGDIETACNTANAWCGVDTHVRGACGDRSLWRELTQRVFGVEATGVAQPRAFFRDVCGLFKTTRFAINASDGKTALETVDAWCKKTENACDDPNLWKQLLKRVFGVEETRFPKEERQAVFRRFCETVDKYRDGDRRMWRHRNEDRGNRAFVLAAVRHKGENLYYASSELKNDKDIVLAAVRHNGENLYYASSELENDKDIVLVAAQSSGYVALEMTGPDLRDDATVVLAAVKNNGAALRFASERLNKDRAIVLAAVQQYGPSLSFADPALKRDKSIVLVAVEQDGYALVHADETMRDNREVVLAAVRNYGPALEWASETLRNDREVVLAAVSPSQDVLEKRGAHALRDTLKLASPELQQGADVVLAAVSHNGLTLQYAPKAYRNDRATVLAAVQENGEALEWASAVLKNDKDVVIAAVREAGIGAYRHASRELQKDPEVVKYGRNFRRR